jgi:hypothetical protein
MILALLAIWTQSSAGLISQMDALAQKRDVAGLQALIPSSETLAKRHLSVLKTNGCYDCGKFGWRAVSLIHPDGGEFVVLATPLTNEDAGEMLFEIRNGKIDRYLYEGDAAGYRILDHTFDVRFDVPAKKALIQDEIRLRTPGRTDRPLFFRISPHYRVRSITDEKGKAQRFVQASGVILIPDAANEMGVRRYKLTYDGVVNLPGYAGAIIPDEAMLTNDYWYPMVSRLPSTYTVTIHTSSDWLALAQGKKVSGKVDGQSRVTQYQMDLPVTYFSLVAGKYAYTEANVLGKTHRVWATGLSPQQRLDQTQLQAPVYRFYADTFGVDPFGGYGAMIAGPYGGGAMEGYSFATYGVGWLPDEDAHEPAHTWFGGVLDNTYLNSYWNESFAVYCEMLYGRTVPIGDVEDRDRAFVQTANPDPSWDNYALTEGNPWIGGAASSLGYGKGAYVLAMLENEVGKAKMIQAIRAWVKGHPKGEPADWRDFEAVFLKVNPGYEWFFRDWVRTAGILKLEISKVRWEGKAVHLDLKQSGPPKRITVEALVEFADGSREFRKFDSTKPEVVFPVREKPVLVSIDPWRKLVRDTDVNEEPVSWTAMRASKVFALPSRGDMVSLKKREDIAKAPTDLDKVLLVGRPEDSPQLAKLAARVGFLIRGDRLSYEGTEIDLKKGGAVALFEDGGKRFGIAIGNPRYGPNVGRARIAVVDEFGRFLKGKTEPKTSGNWVFKL